jgi:hypothetical protein
MLRNDEFQKPLAFLRRGVGVRINTQDCFRLYFFRLLRNDEFQKPLSFLRRGVGVRIITQDCFSQFYFSFASQ